MSRIVVAALAAVFLGMDPARGLGVGGPAGEARWVADAAARRKALWALKLGQRKVLADALGWLVAHQDEDGRWDCDEFMKHDPPKDRCDGPGQPEHDVGVTGLAVLALLCGTDSERAGKERAAAERGLRWLVEQQGGEEGLIGPKIGHSYLYNHGIATTALAEGVIVLGMDELAEPLQKAVRGIHLARNPNGAWRYDLPSTGDNDTSATAWMVAALVSAREAGATIDQAALEGALKWVDDMTDAESGRVGYDSAGSASSRVPGINDRYTTEGTEAMTAAGLLIRCVCGEDPNTGIAAAHAELLAKAAPSWDADGLVNDFYYWYYGASALHQVGGKASKAWSRLLAEALEGAQRTKRGAARGSWDPIGPWGFAGGRMYSTAMAVLALAAPVRHQRLSGK